MSEAASMSIAIVNSSSFGKFYPEHLKRLEALGHVERITCPPTTHGEELANLLAPFDAVIASVTPIFDAEFFAHKSDLRLLARHGIGYDNVDVSAASEVGCTVTIVSALIERDAVAETSVALLMDSMRSMSASITAGREGRWADRASFLGPQLSGKTLGVIGCGNIGTRVAEILGAGFGMEVLAYDPVPRPDWAAEHNVRYVELDELLEATDVISMNAKLTEESARILNASAFAKMKSGTYIVNCARAGLIDEAALLDVLESGQVAGYATDVMSEEPPAPDHPFFAHPKVLVATHISAYTNECLEGMGNKCVEDVERLVRGEAPVDALN